MRTKETAPLKFGNGPGMRDPFVYTDDQAEGAIPNGSRVRKVNSEPEDANPDLVGGRVIGSLAVPAPLHEQLAAIMGGADPGPYIYFVEWDSSPGFYVAVMARKVASEVQ